MRLLQTISIWIQFSRTSLKNALPLFASALLLVTAATQARADVNSCANLFALTGPQLTQKYDQAVTIRKGPSPGVASALIEEARKLKVMDDFKILSDLRPKDLTRAQTRSAIQRAVNLARQAPADEARRVYVRSLIGSLFDSGTELRDAPEALTRARWSLADGPASKAATVETIERTWSKLVKLTPPESKGSLIPMPFPVIIPGARFQESYYWDSYFGIKALLLTDRWDLAAMQVENFLFAIENYGLVPNGMRDYYLTRSQPPLLSSMIRDVYDAGLRAGKSKAELDTWLAKRAYPLVKSDYENFWMNPKTRFDERTGLNHHWDAKNTPREERHGSDDESALGKTYRDVRAGAESGKDFTDASGGLDSELAPVLLNSILYKVEIDLAWMSTELGQTKSAATFTKAAAQRKIAINTYLWNPKDRTYRDYQLRRGVHSPVLTADIFVPLWAGISTKAQAKAIVKKLPQLERRGGVLASDVVSGKQWDAPYAWAPQQFFVMDGLMNYGFRDEAVRVGTEWTDAVDRIHAKSGVLIEKVDAVTGDRPIEHGDKYETQEGFLWTNAVYLWTLTDVLGYHLQESPHAGR